MTPEASSDLWYVIDGEDRLVEADQGYFDFAAKNHWPAARDAIGRPLWDFVSGGAVRAVQKSLIRRIRRTGGTVVLPFRCDGPSVRRELMLSIGLRGGDGWIVFSSVVLKEQWREYQPFLDRSVPRKARQIKVCSWCGQFDAGPRWSEIEDASPGLHLSDLDLLPGIEDDLCNRCVLTLAEA